MVVQLYAPLPAASMGYLCRLLRHGVPHLAVAVRQFQKHAKSRYAHAQVDGLLWFWPQGENPWGGRHQVDDRLRFLAPFDPVVWDRRRFKLFWGWEYLCGDERYVALALIGDLAKRNLQKSTT